MAAALLMDRTSTTSRISRVTKAGRKLKYVLTVIQQPERARACGSGAKSSSDRRPVDPPPVVELKIYCEDGPTIEDITFGYEANFFLFVTLDAASPATRSRTHPSTAQTYPVLTGMPVSGMAYLDRPSEAGYFIFPDLSVRHEGHYVLCFNLYEECKNDCDRDTYQRRCSFEESSEAESSFDWRMEVKSLPFTVYSAKKFPGLTESTHLSRIVAEQGCRVRIRRDARMRRRDQKIDLHTNHQDYYCHPEDEEEYDEPARSCSFGGSTKSTPIPRPGLGRSCSDITLQNRHRYSTAGHRSRLPSIDLQLPSGKSPSFPQLPLPRPIQPPAEPNAFSFAKIPSKYCFENRTYLSHAQILNPSRELQDYDRNPRRSSTCYTQPFNARNFGTPEYCQKSPPSHVSCSPSSPKTSPHSDTKAFSLTTKLLPPLNTNSLIERNTSARMSNKETLSYAHGYTSSIPLENCLPPLSKRPLETALPSIAAVTSARLFNGSRPLSPGSYYSKQQDELAHRGDLMSYRRASGAVQVRGPPVFS